MRPAALAVLAGAVLLAQGCATKPVEYGPIGEKKPFGYKDLDNADGGHTVLVVMPPAATPDQARAFWDRRAEELCTAGVDRRNVFRVDRDERFGIPGYVSGQVTVGNRLATSIQVEGYVYCKSEPKPAGQTAARD